MGQYSVSIVSHGQGRLVDALLSDLEECAHDIEVLAVVNVPEDLSYLRRARRFPVTPILNLRPLGFGANHNAAFARAQGRYFVVANPDIRLTADPFPRMSRVVDEPRVAVCGPQVLSPHGTVEDSARRFPTVTSLLRRRVRASQRLDYRYEGACVHVDWIAGMFMMFRRESFQELGGFDIRYHMYFEDVDLCYRARQAGQDVVVLPDAQVVHAARRSSRRSARYALWHARSAARYFALRAMERVCNGRARSRA